LAGRLIPLYFYGELTPEEEEQLEQHTHVCTGCAANLERQRSLDAALDERAMTVPPALLEDCRADLMAAIQAGPARKPAGEKGPWRLFVDAIAESWRGVGRVRQPVAAMALIAVGFFAGHVANTGGPRRDGIATPAGDDVFSVVRSVQPDNAGGVAISFDETRRRQVHGSMSDSSIQRLLLAAAHEDNPAVRVESVDLLRSQPGSTEVRDVLLNVLAQDANAGVRLKALEGLKPLAADADVRQTLRRVLMADDNPAVRMQAIDLLVAHRDGDNTVGMMQGLVQRENNNSVRLKLEKALRDMNASPGTF